MVGPPERPVPWHSLAPDEAARRLESNLDRGLSAAEAQRRLDELGENRLPEEQAPGPLRLLLDQFASLLVYVLIGAAILSLVIGDVVEFAAIVIIAVLNAVLGFVQEYRAEQALSALKSMSAPSATVLRDGNPQRVPSSQVVPGDVLVLEAGDIVAADARITQTASLSTSEAVLTGESLPVDKRVEPVDADADLAERLSMAYQGTIAARGRGQALVVATGAATEMGRIAVQVGGNPRGQTPLQRQLAVVGRYLVIAAAVLCVFVFIVGVLRGISTSEMLLTAASLAVAAIPEGLPAAATIVLALGVQRMAARHVIVRRLSSVETLGAVTTIFTDKTGTLTENRMRVAESWPLSDEADLVRIAALCNNATLSDENGAEESGDPTEVALLAYARDHGEDVSRARLQGLREMELPFDAARARMTVVVRGEDSRRQALTKGAPEVLLRLASQIGGRPASETLQREVQERSSAMASQGMRVLALATRHLAGEVGEDDIERDLDLAGLVGLADPLRPEAAQAIERARDAGIRVVMLTGDQPATAASIGSGVGLGGDVITGRDVEDLPVEALEQRMKASEIFARVTSEHKLKIVEAARDAGEVVAMTGDGVNDAPALRSADIGIAMGRGGTDVAREAGDMVLTDDNFASIMAAVEEGRSIHANIRRFIHFLLSCNAAEIAVVFLALLAIGESPLTPLQILFVNLLTDGLPALALGVEPAVAGVMRQRPRGRDATLISIRSLTPVLGIGSFIAAASLLALAAGRAMTGDADSHSMAFATLVASQLTASIVFRNETRSALDVQRNPWLIGALAASLVALLLVFAVGPLRDVFKTVSLSADEWLVVAALSLTPLVAGELAKATGLITRLGLGPAGDE